MRSKSDHASTLLVVEDDTSVRSLLASSLRSAGYTVLDVPTLSGATRLLQHGGIDAMILDLELEDGEGFELLRLPHAEAIITLVISVRTDIVDRLISLELGADDYIVKPVDLRELNLRLKRSLKRKEAIINDRSESNIATIDNELSLDLVERVVFSSDYRSSQLTKLEFRALRMLIAEKNRVFSREFIAKELLGRRVLGDSRSVDALMSKLRRKLDPSGHNRFIVSMRGEGYIFSGPHDISQGGMSTSSTPSAN